MRRPVVIELAGLGLAGVLLRVAGSVPAVRFVRERIEVTVRPGVVEVDGVYEYANPWPVALVQGLDYPFPEGPAYEAPHALRVTEADPTTGGDRREIPVVWVAGKPRYSVLVPGRGILAVRVRYAQRVQGPAAAYILTTTRSWGAPLERGEYVLVPRGVRITGSDYPLDGPDRRSFGRDGFMPDKDWGFTWANL